MQLKNIIFISIFVLALLIGTQVASAYYYQPVYPTRNYYMLDYYAAPHGPYYNPYTYSYTGHFYGNYYNDPNWKYYTLNTFTGGKRYGFY